MFTQSKRPRSRRPAAPRACLQVEALESRVVAYSVSGNKWPNPELITLSFVPDGTSLSGRASNLFATLDARFGSTSRWQNEILRAAQVWAQQTNLNFALVSDNGAPAGSGNYQQGDPGFGDIRIGGYNFGNTTLAQAYLPPPVNNFSIAGDIQFNTGQSFNIGSTYDLFTVAAHEFGHALGLYHSSVGAAEEYATYGGIKNILNSDDISGIRNTYSNNLGRSADQYDTASSNNSFATATDITSQINPSSRTAVLTNLNITSTSDVDYYLLSGTTPTSTGQMTVQVQSRGLSLLAPTLTVYAANQTTVVASASGAGQYGTTLSVTFSGVGQGSPFYIKVAGADGSALGTGAYALTLNSDTGASPTVPLPNTQTAKGNPTSAGGGQAVKVELEVRANTYTAGDQYLTPTGQRELAMDANGNYVITWTSQGQDGSGAGVYAQRFNQAGNQLGSEFRVNTTTAGDQAAPSLAMGPNGNFVITWSSRGQGLLGSWDIYARRYNSAGVALGGEFRVNTTTAGDQQYSSVALDDLGNFVITWTSTGQDGSGTGVYARYYTLLGLSLTGEFRVNTTTAGDQMHANVAMNNLGDAVITWASQNQDGSGWSVYARLYTLLGLPLSGEIRVNTTTAGDQTAPSVAMDALGNFVVTWSSAGQDGSGWGIYARRYNLLGLALGSEFQVNTTTEGDQKYSSVAMDSVGNFLITWTDYGVGEDGSSVRGQQYGLSGVALEGEIEIQSTIAGDQMNAKVAMDSLGHVVVAWSGNGVGDDSGVFVQRFSTWTINEAAEHDHDHGHGQQHDHEDCGRCHCSRCSAATGMQPEALPVSLPPTEFVAQARVAVAAGFEEAAFSAPQALEESLSDTVQGEPGFQDVLPAVFRPASPASSVTATDGENGGPEVASQACDACFADPAWVSVFADPFLTF